VHNELPVVPFADMLGAGKERLYVKMLEKTETRQSQRSNDSRSVAYVKGSVRESDNVFKWEETMDVVPRED
jgi:hypothetical protein